MTSQARALGGLVPPGAVPGVGYAARVKTTAPFLTEWYLPSASSVSTVAGRTGDVTLTHSDLTDWASALSGYATLADPTFSGTPQAPTPSPGSNNAQIATTAYVQTAVSGSVAGVSSWNSRTGAVTFTFADITGVFPAGSGLPLMDSTGSAGINNTWSRSDHVHPSDTSRLALSGGTMTGLLTLSADPTTNYQAATKQYVDSVAGVSSFNSRQGAVTLIFGDITAVFPAGTTTPVMDGTGTAGSANFWSRSDHVHPSDTSRVAVSAAASTNPVMDGTAAPGSSGNWSRADHVHPSDTSKLSLSGGTMTGALVLAADPAANLQPATKQYVDNIVIDCGTY